MEPAAAVPNEAVAAEEPPAANPGPAVREQDRLMPVANVARIMRRVIPPYAKISDDAKEVVQECVSEFISFVTSEANDRCQSERRKTVTAEDVVWALNRLGFDDCVAPLTTYLRRMRESEGGGGGGGRGSRRGGAPLQLPPARVHPPAAAAAYPQQQPPPAPYPAPAAPQAAYAAPPVTGPVPPGAAPQFGGQYQQHQLPAGGEGPMAAYYGGGAAFQAGGSGHRGFHADEGSSSTNEPAAPRPGSHY